MSWILSIILRNQIRGKQISGKALDGSSTDSLWVGTLHREGRGEPTLYLVNFNKKWGREKLFQVILVEQEEEEETKEEKIQAGKADSHFKHPILIVTESTDRPLLKHPEVRWKWMAKNKYGLQSVPKSDKQNAAVATVHQ